MLAQVSRGVGFCVVIVAALIQKYARLELLLRTPGTPAVPPEGLGAVYTQSPYTERTLVSQSVYYTPISI